MNVSEVVVPLAQTSVTATTVMFRFGLTADFIHIDGAHEYGPVRQDIRIWCVLCCRTEAPPLLQLQRRPAGRCTWRRAPRWPARAHACALHPPTHSVLFFFFFFFFLRRRWPYVRYGGGILMGDDIFWPGVAKAVSSLRTALHRLPCRLASGAGRPLRRPHAGCTARPAASAGKRAASELRARPLYSPPNPNPTDQGV